VITSPRPNTQRSGRVRAARLTDLAALGELSRQSHLAQDGDARMLTLGLPVGSSHVGVFTLFRLPLSALLPGDLLYVYEEDGKVEGLVRMEHDGGRDEWTVVELDAVDAALAGDVRYRLLQRVLRDASKRGGLRFHVACSDDGDNVELFMQAGFARYGEETLLYRAPDAAPINAASASDPASHGIRSAVPLDALALDRLYRRATPGPVARLEDYRQSDWERQGNHWRVPRSALTPILRFADVDGFVQEGPGAKSDGQLVAFCQIGVSKADQPDYIRVVALPDHDPSDIIAFGLSAIAERNRSRWSDLAARWQRFERSSVDRGIVSAVRTYESPLERRFEDQGFSDVATVSLLMREAAERVTKPALVPAVLR
jgi:hypothetical protein